MRRKWKCGRSIRRTSRPENNGRTPAARTNTAPSPDVCAGSSIHASIPATRSIRKAVRNAFRESVDLEARTSFQPSVALASASQWQLLGPGNFAGRVNAIAVDYSNSQTIYVCTASAGVWRSMNGGTNWTDIGAGLGTNFTGAVTVDFNNASVVYVGTGDLGFRPFRVSACSSRSTAATHSR